ncbi:uncharacterized protein LOC106140282 isoform X2 [Amyelois transitella]|uniref:uncharacterized protein LOC106140282 isoform X2 n=1 Tax=Amyelois transitella TaxID=680683 RepID=UPI00067B69AD|nr:uncharacterized protein LOC106140282 isoform X2 [Amyelois transitella]
MRCINCDVDIQRLRRHTTSSLPNDLRAILTGWLSVEIPMDSNICHVCFELLNSNIAADGRLFGFTKLCVACGHSLRKARQRHTLERNHSMLQNLPQSHPALHQPNP